MARKLAPGIREKRPGYFEVRVYGGVDPLTGKTLQMSRAVRGTVKDANELRARLMVEVARRGAGTDRTVLHLFETVLDHLETLGREQTTLVDYRQIAGRFDDAIGGLPLRKLRVTHLDAFYAELLRSGLTAARVRRYHSFVHRCLAQAVRWEWLHENVAGRASPPPVPQREMQVATADEVVALIDEAEASRRPELAVAIRLLAATGGRRGEACGLQWHDIDVTTGVCKLRRAVKQVGRQTIVGDLKNHQHRTVLLDAGSLAVLAQHQAAMRERAAACGDALVAAAFVLSDSVDGAEPWKPGRLTRAFDRLRERTGFAGSLHDLRHWHASQLLAAGEAPINVADRLGHRDASTTHRFYAHAMPRSDVHAASIIGDALGNQRPIPQSASAPTPQSTENRVAQRRELVNLHAEGVLTDDEFEREKQRFLAT